MYQLKQNGQSAVIGTTWRIYRVDISLKDLSLIVRSKQHRLLYILKHKTRLPDFDFSDIKYLEITSSIFYRDINDIQITAQFPRERVNLWVRCIRDEIYYTQKNQIFQLCEINDLQPFELSFYKTIDILLFHKAKQYTHVIDPVDRDMFVEQYNYETFNKELRRRNVTIN